MNIMVSLLPHNRSGLTAHARLPRTWQLQVTDGLRGSFASVNSARFDEKPANLLVFSGIQGFCWNYVTGVDRFLRRVGRSAKSFVIETTLVVVAPVLGRDRLATV
jgi:hypothetical protein